MKTKSRETYVNISTWMYGCKQFQQTHPLAWYNTQLTL